MKPLFKKRDGVCSRGWLFMGEQGGPCDKKCEMCYYAWQSNLVFFSHETLLHMANLFRHYYGLDAADITGGEPTIYKRLPELVRHCANIGLAPTIITHGQNLHPEWKLFAPAEIEDAGLEDWLVSLHGNSAESHDKVLCETGSFGRLTANMKNLQRPVRFNTTLLTDNYKDLPWKWLTENMPPTVWNIINFNPFHAWSVKREIDFQVPYREAAPHVAEAVAEFEKAGWEVNVRYWPMCIADEFGFAENVSGYHQVPYDPWEWRLNVTGRAPMEEIAKVGWDAAERATASKWMANRSNKVCDGCAWNAVCDSPPEQYQERYAQEELVPQEGEPVTNPLHWQRHREVRS